MTTYSMVTISGNTRIRKDHNVYAEVITTIANANVMVFGDELWTAQADGDEVKVGDKWLRMTYNGVIGWMAYIHKGVSICKNFTVMDTPSEPIQNFPEYFILTDPQGKQARFDFTRLVE